MSQSIAFTLVILPPFLVWAYTFFQRKDLRQELVVMSIIVGFVAVFFSSYFWMTTLAVHEQFLAGFFLGGVVAVIYELVFKQTLHVRKAHHHTGGAFTIILILAALALFLFHIVGLTTFWSTAVTFVFVAGMMVLLRKDLFVNAVLSGVLMVMVMLVSYCFIAIASPSMFLVMPVQEIIFWFLAGTVFGPFYEYWQGEKLQRA